MDAVDTKGPVAGMPGSRSSSPVPKAVDENQESSRLSLGHERST
jgi:hypothetical protein